MPTAMRIIKKLIEEGQQLAEQDQNLVENRIGRTSGRTNGFHSREEREEIMLDDFVSENNGDSKATGVRQRVKKDTREDLDN